VPVIVRRPGPPLNGLVRAIIYRAGEQAQTSVEKILPSPETGLWVNLNRDEFRSFDQAGAGRAVPGAMLAGPTSRACTIEFEQGHAHVSVAFALGAADRFAGPSLAETLFDGGRRRATSTAARANYDSTVANYRESALTAFQQVEDNLAALRILSQEAQQQKEATASAEESLQIFTNRYIGGRDPYLQVLTAQTIALQNERNDVDILRRRMDASVLLIKALGGGWTVSELPKTAELR